jgi:hypothetical protein
MTLIYEKYPKKLPSNKQATYRFCTEHHIAGDLISAHAEETVMELTHQSLDALAKYFKKNLDLVLFTKDAILANAGLGVDIRNVITHNRGIVNRFFIQRNPRFANDLGKSVVLGEQERREMLSTLGYCARQLDVRAIKKFWAGDNRARVQGIRKRTVTGRRCLVLGTAWDGVCITGMFKRARDSNPEDAAATPR